MPCPQHRPLTHIPVLTLLFPYEFPSIKAKGATVRKILRETQVDALEGVSARGPGFLLFSEDGSGSIPLGT